MSGKEMPVAADRKDPTARSVVRRRVLLALGALVLVAAVAIAFSVTRGSDSNDEGGADGNLAEDSSSTSSATSTAAQTSATAAPPATTPAGVPGAPAPTLAPVPLDETAEFGDEISAALSALEEIDGQGEGIGEISGPALRVTISLNNGTANPLSLDAVTVNLTFGADATPAVPLSDPSQQPFSGMLDPGQSAEGSYVFAVPLDVRDLISVTVSHSPASPTVVFNGPV